MSLNDRSLESASEKKLAVKPENFAPRVFNPSNKVAMKETHLKEPHMGAATNKQVTVTDLVEMMYDLYPGIQDTRADFGFEHAVAAVGVVLLGAAILGTIDLSRLARFTKYSPQFIAAIAFNMQNNKLWLNGRYDTSTWLHDDGSIEDRGLINHVAIAYGDRRVPGVEGKINTDPCQIYWYERRRN